MGGWGIKIPPNTPQPQRSSYNSGTKSDKKLIFSGSINAGARSILVRGVGGLNTPPLSKSKFQLYTQTNLARVTIFDIYTHVSYIIIPIKYENPILKSPGFIEV